MKTVITIIALFFLSNNSNSQVITTVVGNGTAGFSGDGGLAIDANIGGTAGIWVDNSGNIFFADQGSDRIRKVDASTGIITSIAGRDPYGFSGDGGLAVDAQIQSPFGLCLDAAGNVYFTDTPNNRIRKITVSTGIINTIAGKGSQSFSGDGGLAINAYLNYPEGIRLDATGNIYFADRFNHRIRKIDVSTGIITTIAGNGTLGYSGDGGLAINATLNHPCGVFVDASNDVYIVDLENSCIRKINTATGIISTVAGTGVGGFSGDGGLATNAQIKRPLSIFVDASKNIFIADMENHVIRKVDSATGIINTIIGSGVAGFNGDGGSPFYTQLDSPIAVFVDNNETIYFSDGGNSRIRKMIPSPTIHTPGLISGNQNVCAESINTYSISPVPAATYYTWNLPSGWTGTSTGTSITVTSNSTSGEISVTASNADSTTLPSKLQITVNSKPTKPSIIQTTNILSCSVTADSYQWYLNDNKIIDATNQNYSATQTGNYKVEIFVNGCSSISEAINVQAPPLKPGIISGNTNVCVGSYNVYSIDNVVDANDYTWSLPNSWTGTSTTNAISVKASSTSGNISVTANNANGSSLPQILEVKANALPAEPSITTAGDILTSSIVANSYQWYVGNKIIENATNRSHTAIKVGFYQVEITDANACSEKSDSLFIKPSDIFDLMWNNKKLITMYPNPVKNELFIEAEMFKNTSAEISNIEGKIIQIVDFTSSKTIINTANFAKGIYFIKIKNELGIGVRKFTKE